MGDLTIPEYFPLTVKPCFGVSQDFFKCFTEKGKMQNDTDREAGRRGLRECADELRGYKGCMDKNSHLSKHYFKD